MNISSITNHSARATSHAIASRDPIPSACIHEQPLYIFPFHTDSYKRQSNNSAHFPLHLNCSGNNCFVPLHSLSSIHTNTQRDPSPLIHHCCANMDLDYTSRIKSSTLSHIINPGHTNYPLTKPSIDISPTSQASPDQLCQIIKDRNAESKGDSSTTHQGDFIASPMGNTGQRPHTDRINRLISNSSGMQTHDLKYNNLTTYQDSQISPSSKYDLLPATNGISSNSILGNKTPAIRRHSDGGIPENITDYSKYLHQQYLDRGRFKGLFKPPKKTHYIYRGLHATETKNAPLKVIPSDPKTRDPEDSKSQIKNLDSCSNSSYGSISEYEAGLPSKSSMDIPAVKSLISKNLPPVINCQQTESLEDKPQLPPSDVLLSQTHHRLNLPLLHLQNCQSFYSNIISPPPTSMGAAKTQIPYIDSKLYSASSAGVTNLVSTTSLKRELPNKQKTLRSGTLLPSSKLLYQNPNHNVDIHFKSRISESKSIIKNDYCTIHVAPPKSFDISDTFGLGHQTIENQHESRAPKKSYVIPQPSDEPDIDRSIPIPTSNITIPSFYSGSNNTSPKTEFHPNNQLYPPLNLRHDLVSRGNSSNGLLQPSTPVSSDGYAMPMCMNTNSLQIDNVAKQNHFGNTSPIQQDLQKPLQRSIYCNDESRSKNNLGSSETEGGTNAKMKPKAVKRLVLRSTENYLTNARNLESNIPSHGMEKSTLISSTNNSSLNAQSACKAKQQAFPKEHHETCKFVNTCRPGSFIPCATSQKERTSHQTRKNLSKGKFALGHGKEGRSRQLIKVFDRDSDMTEKSDSLQTALYSSFQGKSMKKKSSKLNQCKVCGKVVTRTSSLQAHMLIHTKAQPFECKWPGCGKRFNVKSNMNRHYRLHVSREHGHQEF